MIECFRDSLSASCSLGTLASRECLDRVYAICVTMLRARGYVAVEGSAVEMLDRMTAGEPVMRGRESDRGRPDLVVYFHCTDTRVGIQTVRDIESAAEGSGGDPAEVLIVSLEGPTSFTRRDVGDRVQFMCYRHLMYDLSRHCMVPPHRLLSAAEAASATDRFEVREPAHWPQLPFSDPVAQYYGFKHGDLVEILRHGAGTNGLSVYYRMVA